MKIRTLWLVAMLTIASLTLAGCNKNDTPAEPEETLNETEETLSEAAEYCIAQGWTHQIVTSETAVFGECTLADGTVCEEWDFFEGRCPAEGENILPEGAKTSLTLEDLDNIDATNFPKGYSYSQFNLEENLIGNEWEYTYPEDFSHSLLIPEHATMANREIVSSGIEDGMIYTLTNVTLQDDTQIQILYIVDPVTLQYVAASVENWNTSTNYQFVY